MHQESQDEVRPGRTHESAVQHFSFQHWPLKHSDGVWTYLFGWVLILFVTFLQEKNTDPPTLCSSDRHITGTHSRDQYKLGKIFNKLFLKAFLVFLTSGSSGLLQPQTLSQRECGGDGVIKLSKISDGRGKRRDWLLGDKET